MNVYANNNDLYQQISDDRAAEISGGNLFAGLEKSIKNTTDVVGQRIEQTINNVGQRIESSIGAAKF